MYLAVVPVPYKRGEPTSLRYHVSTVYICHMHGWKTLNICYFNTLHKCKGQKQQI